MFDRDPFLLLFMKKKALALINKVSVPRWMVFFFDCIVVFLAFIFAYLLRHNLIAAAFPIALALWQGLITTGIYAIFSLVFRSYSGLIRHTTIMDIFNVFITCTLTVISLIVISLITRHSIGIELLNLPISILLIHYVSVIVWLFLIRISIKIFFELVTNPLREKKNVLIFGAGSMGVIVMNVILEDQVMDYNIVGFLDNNKQLQQKNLNGIKVFNPKVLSKSFLEKHEVDMLIFAITNIIPSEKSEIISTAIELGMEVLEVPAVDSWLNGRFQVRQLQKVKLEDLLGRDPIQLNMKVIGKGLRDRTILITGAAGSIGSEIMRQLSRFEIGKLILIDNAETPLFHLENELREHFPLTPLHTILADITDQVKMDRIFKDYRPQIVFHAAAYKHVPMLEENPHEAIRVNVGGSALLTKLSVKYEVRKFVLISTDKAVNPTNVMGASKRICELILQSRSQTPGNRTQFVITRFGNVLGSNGSVIPIFTKQIEKGGPVTVTHPKITRYFMTIPEACQLVLEAGFMGIGGEIFIFEMGKPIKIVDLVRKMIQLSGFVPDQDIKIEFTGLRLGEKLHEELLTGKEETKPTYNPKLKVAVVERIESESILSKIHSMLYSFQSMSVCELIKLIEDIVPEYRTSNKNFSPKDGSPESMEMEVFPD